MVCVLYEFSVYLFNRDVGNKILLCAYRQNLRNYQHGYKER